MSGLRFNVSIIGESKVGKTSLVQVLTGFEFSEVMLTTMGIDHSYIEKKFDGKSYKFVIFDTAGQEKYKSLSSSTVQIAHGFLLVFSVDDKNSFIQINDWIEVIKDCVDLNEKIIYLVGNKNDIEKREVTEKEAKEYADSNKMKYFETSAKLNKGVNEVFNEIFNDIYKLYKKLEGKKEQNQNFKLQNKSNANNNNKKKKKC